ncbi:hypothetical protein MASR2M74_37480 [Paracoccaceae bacterium]
MPALERRPAGAAEAYVAMIEENEIRQGLFYYERARIVARSVDLGVFSSETLALQWLFAAESRARRSNIGSFLTLYRHLNVGLRFVAAIRKRLGLALVMGPETRPEAAASLTDDLQTCSAASAAEAAAARLARFTAGPNDAVPEETPIAAKAESRVGTFLQVSGGFSHTVLTLSGRAVDLVFRARPVQRLLPGL